MERFRREVTGRPEVLVGVYTPIQTTPIYKNTNQKPPNLDHPKHPRLLLAKSQIKVLLIKDEWAQIKVVSATGGLNKTEGWIKASDVNTAQQNPKTRVDTLYYQLNPKAPAQAPPTLLKQSPLDVGVRLRLDKFEEAWALVAALEPVKGHKFLEGWVKADEIQLISEEWLIYPPPFVEDKPVVAAKVAAAVKPLVQPRVSMTDKKTTGPGTGKE
jgi:hypothetical protein